MWKEWRKLSTRGYCSDITPTFLELTHGKRNGSEIGESTVGFGLGFEKLMKFILIISETGSIFLAWVWSRKRDVTKECFCWRPCTSKVSIGIFCTSWSLRITIFPSNITQKTCIHGNNNGIFMFRAREVDQLLLFRDGSVVFLGETQTAQKPTRVVFDLLKCY